MILILSSEEDYVTNDVIVKSNFSVEIKKILEL